MANKWIAHIKKTMKQMKKSGTYRAGQGLKQVILAAKKTWHSAKKQVGLKGGADGDDLEDVDLTPASSPPSAKPASTSGMEVNGEAVTGGRRRTRRRRHTRRR